MNGNIAAKKKPNNLEDGTKRFREKMKAAAATNSFEQYMQAGLYRKALNTARKCNLPEDMTKEAEKKIS